MFQSGKLYLYGSHGVCRLLGTEERMVDRKKVEYYVLEPNEQPGARYYIPTGNPNALKKLRPVMDREALTQLLQCAKIHEDAWIPDEGQRKQYYRQLIADCDRVLLLQMVNTIHRKKRELLNSGKRLHICDENFCRDAQKLLDGEFTLVLGVDKKEVQEYIQNLLPNI